MSANDDDNSQLPSVEGAQSSGLGMSLVDRGKQYSVESVKTLDRIEALRSTYQSMLREVEQIHKSTDLNNYTSVSRSKSRLAQLLGSIEKLQFNQLDAVSTVHLDSGKAEAKSTRRELNAALDDLQDFVTSLHAKYAAVPAPPVLSPSSTTSEEGDGETMGDSGSSEVDERSLHSEGESDSDSDSDSDSASECDGDSDRGDEFFECDNGTESEAEQGLLSSESVTEERQQQIQDDEEEEEDDEEQDSEEAPQSAETGEARKDEPTDSTASAAEWSTSARCSDEMDGNFLHQWLQQVQLQAQRREQEQEEAHIQRQQRQRQKQRQLRQQQLQRQRQWELQQQQQRQWELQQQQQRQWELQQQQQRQWELQQQQRRQWELQQQRQRQLQRQRQWELQQQRQQEMQRAEQFYFRHHPSIFGGLRF